MDGALQFKFSRYQGSGLIHHVWAGTCADDPAYSVRYDLLELKAPGDLAIALSALDRNPTEHERAIPLLLVHRPCTAEVLRQIPHGVPWLVIENVEVQLEQLRNILVDPLAKPVWPCVDFADYELTLSRGGAWHLFQATGSTAEEAACSIAMEAKNLGVRSDASLCLHVRPPLGEPSLTILEQVMSRIEASWQLGGDAFVIPSTHASDTGICVVTILVNT